MIFCLNFYLGKDFVFVVLVDAEIPLCYPIGRVIIDAHEQSGGSSLFPCIVPESLPQRMAADIGIQAGESGGLSHDSIGLKAA